MTIVELRCTQCEALVERLDDCYDCMVVTENHVDRATQRQLASRFVRKAHCKNGHAFTEENTRIDRSKAAPNGYQVCRRCHNEHCARRRARLSEERKMLSGMTQ